MHCSFADSTSDMTQFDYISAIEHEIPQWTSITTKIALNLFTILWCFETFNQIVFKNVLGNNLKQLPIYLITRLCFLGFFSHILLKPDFYLGIIEYFASHTNNFHISNNKIIGFNVATIFHQFANWNENVYDPNMSKLGISDIGLIITYAIMYIVYLISTCCIALMIIIIKIEVYLVVFGALVLTGFAGSSWTYELWGRYLDAVIGIGVRILVFGLLFNILKNLITVNPTIAGSLNLINSSINILLTTACLYIVNLKTNKPCYNVLLQMLG